MWENNFHSTWHPSFITMHTPAHLPTNTTDSYDYCFNFSHINEKQLRATHFDPRIYMCERWEKYISSRMRMSVCTRIILIWQCSGSLFQNFLTSFFIIRRRENMSYVFEKMSQTHKISRYCDFDRPRFNHCVFWHYSSGNDEYAALEL